MAPAATLPVARVAVDVALAHLDRPFDYAVPEHLDAAAGIGVRVRVRFAGRLVDGFVLERVAASEHAGRLAWLEKVVSTEQALPPEIAALCRAVADRYGGVLADVLRLALPPRHARVEAEAARADSRSDAEGVRARPPRDGDAGLRERCRPAAADGGRGSEPRPAKGHGGRGTPVGGGARDGIARARVVRHGGRCGMGAVGTAQGGADAPRAERRPGTASTSGGWGRYARGPAFLRALGAGRAAHAVWQALPGEAWAERLADAAQATARAGRGALLVVPDQRDVDVLHAACAARLGAEAVVALTADLGPAERYRRWLAVRRGRSGSSSAPARRRSRRSPRPACSPSGTTATTCTPNPAPPTRTSATCSSCAHTRSARRCSSPGTRAPPRDSCWSSRGGPARSSPIGRPCAPRCRGSSAQGESDLQLARDPLARAARLPVRGVRGGPRRARRRTAGAGPDAAGGLRAVAVLRLLPGDRPLPPLRGAPRPPRPRAGAPATTDRSRASDGPAGRPWRPMTPADRGRSDRPLAAPRCRRACRWCGRVESAYRCGACGSRRLRAGVVGSRRTAEELGRAFPGVPVRISGGGAPVLATVADPPEIVVATPGAEPRAAYGAALLLDGWALLARPDLRVAEETLRRWMAAAALVVPHTDGGRVLVMADPGLPPVQALVRWDPVGHAAAELAARAEVGFPPAVRMAAIEGSPAALKDLLDELTAELPAADVLGPVELDPPPTRGHPRRRRRGARTRPGAGAAGAGPRARRRAARRAGGPHRPQGDRSGAGADGSA